MATPTSLPATFVAGNVLTAAQMNNLRGAFRILQVVRATDATSRTTTSTTYVDANISVTITPTSADSDIMLIWTALAEPTGGTGFTFQEHQITDSSNVAISGAEAAEIGAEGTTDTYQMATLIAFDSPATTSATTYKGRFQAYTGNTARIRNDFNTGQLYALEISA